MKTRHPVHYWDATLASDGFTADQIAKFHHVRRAFGCRMLEILAVIAKASLRYELSPQEWRVLVACNAVTGVRCDLVRE